MKKEKIVSFPSFGMYTEVFKLFLEGFGLNVESPVPITKRTINIGVKYTDELMCLPCKILLGNFIESIEKGATHIMTYTTEGGCRMSSYPILHRGVLKKLGYDVELIVMSPFKPLRFLKDIKKHLNPNVTVIQGIKSFFKALKEIKKIEKEDQLKNKGDIKILITGEMYTLIENRINMDLIKKLRKLGVSVENPLSLSYFINHGLKQMFKIDFARKKTLRLAKEHLPFKKLGGHASESILNTLDAIQKNYDGVIHLFPFPCSPETVVTKLLDGISEKYNIPIIHLVFDEHTAEEGVNTRLEAFVDMIKMKKQKNE